MSDRNPQAPEPARAPEETSPEPPAESPDAAAGPRREPDHGADGADASVDPGDEARPVDREEELEQQCAELKDRMLRGAAELENVRKRSARDVAQARQRGIGELAASLLDALDNLERALDSVPEEDRGDSLAQGVALVHQQLLDRLASFDIVRIDPVGQRFDPHFHEALLEEERDDVEPGTVLEELIAGYRMGEALVRASQVRVSRAPAGTTDSCERPDRPK